MPRVSLVEKEQAHPIIREMFQIEEAGGFRVPNMHKVMAHCPYIGRNYIRLGTSIRRGEEVPAKLRELAILRVGNLTQCEYEFKAHVPIALQAGVSQKQIDEISDWAASAKFNDQERAILRYTDEVARDIVVKDDIFAKLQDFLSEHQIVEVTVTIAFYCMVCRILVALQIPREDES